MFSYDHAVLNQIVLGLIRENLSPESFQWLTENSGPEVPAGRFNSTFVALPRKAGRAVLMPREDVLAEIQRTRPNFSVDGWTIDRLARVWLLMQRDAADRSSYFNSIENLFLAAEVNELIALYSALPVLAYPEIWKARCAEGIRNNISDVLTAIMCNNPYPSENLDEAAWNQLVLKAFFTEKPVERIVGLDQRANRKLAHTLSDYAHERWAAGRTVNPLLWRCVAPFVDEYLINDVERLAASPSALDQEAAALTAYHSNHPQARNLVPHAYLEALERGELTWNSLAIKMNSYVLQ